MTIVSTQDGKPVTPTNPLPVTVYAPAGAALHRTEDAPHADGDPGVMALAVRKDTAAAMAGTDGDYAPLLVDANGRLHVALTALPAPAALADGEGPPTTTRIGAGLMGFNAAASLMNRARMASQDGETNSGLLGAGTMFFNEASWDRRRGNTQGTLLALGARTAQTASSPQINHNARGIALHLFVSAKAAATTLTVAVRKIDSLSGAAQSLASSGAFPAAVGVPYMLLVYPGVSNADVADPSVVARSLALPRSFDAVVIPSDANSVTYSLSYALIV